MRWEEKKQEKRERKRKRKRKKRGKWERERRRGPARHSCLVLTSLLHITTPSFSPLLSNSSLSLSFYKIISLSISLSLSRKVKSQIERKKEKKENERELKRKKEKEKKERRTWYSKAPRIVQAATKSTSALSCTKCTFFPPVSPTILGYAYHSIHVIHDVIVRDLEIKRVNKECVKKMFLSMNSQTHEWVRRERKGEIWRER